MPVDYDKLATEHGGSSVDYDSLASQHGGIISNTPGQILAPPPKGPNSLPDELPGAMLRFGVNSLPAIGGVLAGALAPEVSIPAAMLYEGLGGVAGSALKQGTQVAIKDPDAPKSAKDFAKTVALDGALNAGSVPVGRFFNTAVSKNLGKIFNPTEAYQSALRPPPSKTSFEGAEKLINTGLKERIPVSEPGYYKAVRQAKAIDTQIDDILASGPSANSAKTMIDPKDIVAPLQKLRNKIKMGSGDSTALAAIDKVEQDFLANRKLPMTPVEAQEMKQNMYEELRKKNQNAWGKPIPVDDEALKELSLATLNEITQIHPELKELGQQQGGLLELERAISRRVNLENNKTGLPYFALLSSVGLGGGMGAAAGHAEGGAMLGATHALYKIMEDPGVKSQIAIQLSRAGRYIGKTKAGDAALKAAGAAAKGAVPTAIKLAPAIQKYMGQRGSTLPPPPATN